MNHWIADHTMQIIVEVNTSMPSFEGLHDITMTQLPPHRKPYLIMAPEDRVGTTSIPVDTEKIVAIVESDYPDQTVANLPADDTSAAIASHLIEFLEYEVKHDRLPKNLLPIQSGMIMFPIWTKRKLTSIQVSGISPMPSSEVWQIPSSSI